MSREEYINVQVQIIKMKYTYRTTFHIVPRIITCIGGHIYDIFPHSVHGWSCVKDWKLSERIHFCLKQTNKQKQKKICFYNHSITCSKLKHLLITRLYCWRGWCMPLHKYSPYWLFHSTKKNINKTVCCNTVSPLLTVPDFLVPSVQNTVFVLSACSFQIKSCMQPLTKCTMNVRPAAIHSRR